MDLERDVQQKIEWKSDYLLKHINRLNQLITSQLQYMTSTDLTKYTGQRYQ